MHRGTANYRDFLRRPRLLQLVVERGGVQVFKGRGVLPGGDQLLHRRARRVVHLDGFSC